MEDTPNELPDATLPANRQYVVALRSSLMTLDELTKTVAELTKTVTLLVHKVRTTREPAGPDLVNQIRESFTAVEAIRRTARGHR